jgi:hypothetical protein
MENTSQNQNTDQKPEDKDTFPRDWREERMKWREERHEWRMKMRENRWRWPFHGLFFGLTLVLLGVLFLLNQNGTITGDTWWQALLIGLGGISIIDGLTRYFAPGFRWGISGKIIGGVVMILIGSLFMAGMSEWWPVIIIVAGVLMMTKVFWRRGGVCC